MEHNPSDNISPETWAFLKRLFKPHPWHGVAIGGGSPEIVTAFVEIVPTDTVKYEIDKASGYLKIDRPQKFSNIVPALYGFLPQTYCGDHVAEFCRQTTGRTDVIKGDGDPLDICILSEKNINCGNILVQAIPIGGLRLVDNGEADDKIIAVLKDDAIYGNLRDISECPAPVLARLEHYFLTYKMKPDQSHPTCEVAGIYDRASAHKIIQASQLDYSITFGNPPTFLR